MGKSYTSINPALFLYLLLSTAARGRRCYAAASFTVSRARTRGAVSKPKERLTKMTAALVPSAQLRMRGCTYSTPDVPNSVDSSSYYKTKFQTQLDQGGKRDINEQHQRRHIGMSSATPTPHSLPPSSLRHSTLSRIANYYSGRQRHPPTRLNRATTFLNSHSKEKSSYAEDAMDFSNEGETVDLENSPALCQMEIGSNMTNGKPSAATNDVTVESSPSSLELWGIPTQSIILLNLVAVIWGTQHSVIKSVVDDSTISLGAGLAKWMETLGINLSMLTNDAAIADGGSTSGDGTAAYFTLARFGLAALLASPYTPGLRLWVDSLKEKLSGGESETLNKRVNDKDGEEISQSQQNQPRHHADRGTSVASTSHSATMKERESIKLAWRYGVELGFYMFLGYAFQAVGLETTTASRSGFFLYLNVKFVPFFSYFLFGKRIQRNTWISALVAFGGTALLALDNANAATGSAGKGLEMAFTVGDLWSIAAAAVSAMFILRMETASKAVSKPSELNAANLWTVAVLSFLWTLGISWNSLNGSQGSVDVTTAAMQTLPVTIVHATQQTFQRALSTIVAHPLSLIYLSAVTTALANFLQSKAQKDVSAERASIIYAMDPVYGAIFANILLGETLGGIGMAGAFLIVVAAATNALSGFGGGNLKEEVALIGSVRNKYDRKE